MYRRLFGTILLLFVVFLPANTVLADAAPPQYPPGGDVGAGGFETNVQMVSENVLITVESTDPDPALSGTFYSGLVSYDTRAHVDAYFYMVNQGSEVESFDVWFPIGGSSGYSDDLSVDNFAAWVGDTPAEIGTAYTEPEYYKDPSIWATWPVTFYPGQTVTLHVAYYARPTGYRPYGRIEYFLHTGAGWQGTIGEGTVTIRLPYEVNEFNTDLTPADWNGPSPGYYTVSGSEVAWQFSNLEPTEVDDVGLTIMQPSVWQAILSAQEGVQQEPDNPAMVLALARAQEDAIYVKHVIEPVARNIELADLAVETYEQAIDLAPDNVDAYVEYLNLLQKIWYDYESDDLRGKFRQYLDTALALAPDDERLLEIQDFVDRYVATPAPLTPTATMTAATALQSSPSPFPATATGESTSAPTSAPPTTALETGTSAGYPTPQSTQRSGELPCASAGLVLLPAALIASLTRKRSIK